MENWQIEEPDYLDSFELGDDEAFYVEALPCEACGRPVKERDYNEEHELWIGRDCKCSAPEKPICPALYELLMACEYVGELSEVMRTHRQTCALCASIKKPIKGERRQDAAESEAVA